MMSATRSLWLKIRDLPRAGQWLVFLTVFVGGFLVYDELVLKPAANWNADADKIETALNAVPPELTQEREIARLGPTIGIMGDVELPAGQQESQDQLLNAINEVLAAHKFEDESISVREPQSLPPGTLASMVKGNESGKFLQGDISFDASSDEMIAIIGELESRPEIEQISHLTLRLASTRAGQERWSVKLVARAWMIPEAKPIRGARGGGS